MGRCCHISALCHHTHGCSLAYVQKVLVRRLMCPLRMVSSSGDRHRLAAECLQDVPICSNHEWSALAPATNICRRYRELLSRVSGSAHLLLHQPVGDQALLSLIFSKIGSERSWPDSLMVVCAWNYRRDLPCLHRRYPIFMPRCPVSPTNHQLLLGQEHPIPDSDFKSQLHLRRCHQLPE